MSYFLSILVVCLRFGGFCVSAWPTNSAEKVDNLVEKSLKCNYEADPDHGVPHAGSYMCAKYCGWYERNVETNKGPQNLFQCPDEDCEAIPVGPLPTRVSGVPTNVHILVVPDADAFTCCFNDSDSCNGNTSTGFLQVEWSKIHSTTTPEPSTSTQSTTTSEWITEPLVTNTTETSSTTTEEPTTSNQPITLEPTTITEEPTTPEPTTTTEEPTNSTTQPTTPEPTTTEEPIITTPDPTTTTEEPSTSSSSTTTQSTSQKPTTHAHPTAGTIVKCNSAIAVQKVGSSWSNFQFEVAGDCQVV